MSKPRRNYDMCAPVSEIKEYFEYREGKIFWLKSPRYSKEVAGKEAAYYELDGYCYITYKMIKYKRSALVWCLVYNTWPSETLVIDHINKIKNDDRVENLREVTKMENSWNRKNVKGYTWEKDRKKYKVTIMKNGKRFLVGRFDTEEEARIAYEKFKLIHHHIG